MGEEDKKHSLQRRTYKATRSLLRLWRSGALERERSTGAAKQSGIKAAFIYGEKRTVTGADHINRLMAQALAKSGVQVRGFYPRVQLRGAPNHLRGLSNILFFHSLLEHKNEILKYDLIQGTTYTLLPFLTFTTPLVSHFGSSVRGFLDSTPPTKNLPARDRNLYRALFKDGIIPELDFTTLRPLEDTADVEEIVAMQVDACIATSEKVKEELIAAGVSQERVHVIHNAIEDYWFASESASEITEPHLVFLGRLGVDVFTLKLKGFDRLVALYNAFPGISKTTVCMTGNKALKEWLKISFPGHHMFVNLRRDLIPGVLKPRFGSIQLLTSRYEGFSLSMVEGMSQGLVPVSFPVGVAPEIIKNGENGFMVSTVEEAQERIQYLLDHPAERLAMAEAAQRTSQQFRSDTIVSHLTDLYRKLKEKGRTKSHVQ